jgi:hypothetical protein
VNGWSRKPGGKQMRSMQAPTIAPRICAVTYRINLRIPSLRRHDNPPTHTQPTPTPWHTSPDSQQMWIVKVDARADKSYKAQVDCMVEARTNLPVPRKPIETAGLRCPPEMPAVAYTSTARHKPLPSAATGRPAPTMSRNTPRPGASRQPADGSACNTCAWPEMRVDA